MYNLIDTHAHLDEIEDIDDVLTRAKLSGVSAIIAVGLDHQSNRKTMDIYRSSPQLVYPALGLHPWHIGDMPDAEIDATLKFIEESQKYIVAVGEIGLDYDKRVLKTASKDRQKQVLNRLLGLAKKLDKPISIHSRYAWKDCLELVKDAGIERAVFHWFTGFSSVLRDLLETGYYISITPSIEYHEEHRQAVKEAPLNRLLLETDCPVTYGKELKYRAEPKDVLTSLKVTATLKGIDEDSLAKLVVQNTEELFHLSSYSGDSQ